MVSEKRGKSRSLLSATVEVVELQTNTYLKGRISDLSFTGCYLDTLNPLPVTTDVQVRLIHKNESFTAVGIVIRADANMGMGIKFITVEAEQQLVLDRWLANMT